METKSIVILPDSGADLLCVEVHGRIRLDDYMANFYEPMKALIAQFGRYRLLVHYTPSFTGWDPEAADMSFRTIAAWGPMAAKIAYINPPEKKIFQLQLQKSMMGGEVRVFEESALAEAMHWIREKPLEATNYEQSTI